MDSFALLTGDDTALITAIDIDEDGRTDILCQKYDPVSGKSTLHVIYNNFFVDGSFFLKAMMLYDRSKK